MKRAAPEEASGGDDVADPAKRAPLSPAKPDTNVNPPRAAYKPPFRPGGFRPPGGTNPAAGFKSPFVRPAVASAPGAPPSVRPVARPAVRPVFAVPARTAGGGGVSTSSLPIRTQAPTGGSESKSSPKLYFGCLYAKRKAAKNRSSKSWLDGMVMTVPPTTTLLDATGKKIASGKAGTCVAGTEMQIGNFEVGAGPGNRKGVSIRRGARGQRDGGGCDACLIDNEQTVFLSHICFRRYCCSTENEASKAT